MNGYFKVFKVKYGNKVNKMVYFYINNEKLLEKYKILN